MTGHLYEADLEACYVSHSGETVLPLPSLETAVQSAISFMKKGGFSELIAAPMFLYFIAELPKSLTACTQVPTIAKDEVEILSSLSAFLNPVKLGKTVTVNYMKNKAQIEKDAQDIPTFWDSADYLKSGQSLGSIMTTLLGLEQHDLPTVEMLATDSFLN